MNVLKKILVTGGTGFIGSHTVVELAKAGYEPIIADNLSTSEHFIVDQIAEIIGPKPIFYKGDVRNGEFLKSIFSKEHSIEGVIHFAADKAVGESVQDPLKYYDNNIGGLVQLLKTMKAFEVKNFVFSSSCTVYGEPEKIPVTETTPLQPAASSYGNTKKISEDIISDLHPTGVISAAILRYFNPVGAHPSGLIGELPIGKPNNLVPYITQSAIGKRPPLQVFGNDYNTPDGTCIRDYIHVSDLAQAHVKTLSWLDEQKDNQLEIFNLGIGKGLSVLQVIAAFKQATGADLEYSFAPRRAGDVEQIFANPQKAQSMLNWQHEYTIEQAMEHAWKWEKWLEKKKVPAANRD